MQRVRMLREPVSPPAFTPRSRSGGPWGWWLRLTAPAHAQTYEAAPTRAERDRLRRAGLTSAIAPFVAIAPFLLLQQASIDPITMAGIGTLILIVIVSLLLNRAGAQVLAATTLVIGMDFVVEGALLGAGRSGGLGAGWLLTFDLFLIPLITAGLLLSRQYIWMFAALHIGLILGDYYLLPHTADLVALVHLWNGDSIAFARPVLGQVVIAVLTYVGVRSTDQAIARADRAEEIAELERQQLEQRRQLEIGVQQLLETHVRLANGDYSARANLTQDHQLWQVGASLNNLIVRLQRAGQAEHLYRRTEEESRRLVQAIDQARAGRRPIWPAPSGTPIDLIIERIAGRERQPLPPAYAGPEQQISGSPPWNTARQPSPFAPTSDASSQPSRFPPMPEIPSMSGNQPGTGSLDPQWGQRAPFSNPTPRADAPDNPWFMPPEEPRS